MIRSCFALLVLTTRMVCSLHAEDTVIKNNEFGFEITFPKEWMESEDQEPNHPVSFIDSKGTESMTVEIRTVQEGISINQFARSLKPDFGKCGVYLQYPTRDGTRIFHINIQLWAVSGKNAGVIYRAVISGKRAYVMRYTYRGITNVNCYKIFDSFKLIEKK